MKVSLRTLVFAAALSLGISGAARANEPPPQAPEAEPPQASEPPPRPPLAPAPASTPLPWQHHLEIGGDFALVFRSTDDSAASAAGLEYEAAAGYGVHARWELFEYLRFGVYFIDAHHTLVLPKGSLNADSKSAEYEMEPVETFVIGARLSPAYRFHPRFIAWLSAGVGWGRFEFGRMQVSEPGVCPLGDVAGGTACTFTVRERSDAFVEFPFGVGASLQVIPRWLSLDIELTAAIVDDQHSDALGSAQAVDGLGKKRQIGAFPGIDASFVQTIGLSLLL